MGETRESQVRGSADFRVPVDGAANGTSIQQPSR